ncbi:MAG TPA: hypothetical protein VGI81_21895 [Tepidisphaeraceae bacterium]|jgi:hypothetical protein
MTDSIFDPTGPETEHSGTRNLGPDGGNLSHLPPDVAEGKVGPDPNQPDADAETEQIAEAEVEEEADRDRKPPDKTRPE